MAPHDKGIIDEVNKISSATDIKFEGNKDLIQIVGEEVDSVYLNKVKTISIDPEVIKRQKDLKIVYTPNSWYRYDVDSACIEAMGI